MGNNSDKENTHVYDVGMKPKDVKFGKKYKLYKKGFWFKTGNILFLLLDSFLALLFKIFVYGMHVTGRKNIKEIHSCVLLCNHVFPLDIIIILTALFPKFLYVTVLQSNLGLGFISVLLRLLGGVPIPKDPFWFMRFSNETTDIINKGGSIVFYPEASLIPYCDHIRPLLPGAFSFAYDSTKKIIPTVITFHKPKGFYKIVRRGKPCIHYHILRPYDIKDLGDKKRSVEKARVEVQNIMSDFFIKHSDYYYDKNGNRNSTPMPHNRFVK